MQAVVLISFKGDSCPMASITGIAKFNNNKESES